MIKDINHQLIQSSLIQGNPAGPKYYYSCLLLQTFHCQPFVFFVFQFLLIFFLLPFFTDSFLKY